MHSLSFSRLSCFPDFQKDFSLYVVIYARSIKHKTKKGLPVNVQIAQSVPTTTL